MKKMTHASPVPQPAAVKASDLQLPPTQCPDPAALVAGVSTPAYPRLTVFPRATAHPPRYLGFNIEVQDYADGTNLWDWLADSGATVLREFHPEKEMRRQPVVEGAWGAIRTGADFEAFRRRVCADPQAGGVQWDNYLFSERIPWMGVPDEIIRRVTGLGIEPLISMGYAPRMFPRPLVKDVEFTGVAGDERVDWEAAASAYEYYFAMIYHFAVDHGAAHFLLINEPEFRWRGFYHPAEVEQESDGWFEKFFRGHAHEAARDLYFRSLGTQLGVMARIARLALEDVRALPACRRPRDLALSGPVTGKWEAFWFQVAPYVDVFDHHQYSSEPGAYAARHQRLAAEVRGSNKEIGLGEFNLQAGEMVLQDFYFSHARSLKFAEVLMQVLQMASCEGPPFRYAAVYLFHFPCTHRNYKSLVYGDMNLLDWSGRDQALWHGATPVYPSVEQMQLRFATPAYHFFRMLARGAGPGRMEGDGYRVLEAPLTIRDSAVAPTVYARVRSLVVDRGDEGLVINLLNQGDQALDSGTVDLSALPEGRRWVVLRVASRDLQDQVLDEFELKGRQFRVPLPAGSFVQALVTDLDPAGIQSARLVEDSSTPGGVNGLAVWQTTRLRLMAQTASGEKDLTTHNIVWTSDQPDLVRVGQGGLVQRVRASSLPVTIRAALVSGRVLAEVRIPG